MHPPAYSPVAHFEGHVFKTAGATRKKYIPPLLHSSWGKCVESERNI